MRSKWFVGAALGAGLLMAYGQACGAAALGTGFTYQGQLKQSGSPVNGTVDLDFGLWNDPTATDSGNQIGSVQSIAAVSLSSGLFTVQLNSGGEFGASAFNGEQRWLQITVNGTPLTPRQELTAAPNALFALNTATATTASNATNATQLNGQPASFYQNAANIGSGTLADARLSGNVALLGGTQTFTGIKTFSIKPSFAAAGTPFLVSNSTLVTNLNADLLDGLDSTAFLQSVPNPLTLSGTSATHIIRGDNASTVAGASGVLGLSTAASGTTYGVYGQNASTSGRGVFGTATAECGVTYGGVFESASPAGRGVFGKATADSGVTYGGMFYSYSPSGVGVSGWALPDTGNTCGGYFRTQSTAGIGVLGEAITTSGTTYGGFFESASSSGLGVYGEATRASGVTYGGRFMSRSPSGLGVSGEATAASGVNYGVIGASASTSGFDFFANGVGTNYGSTSSRRWKSSIEPIAQPLDKLSRLRGVYFNWDAEHGGRHDVGMIAEEVGAVLPEIVNYEENGVDAIGMDYSKMTPLLVEAVNALRAEKDAELAALCAANDAQQKTINGLIARLERLEKVMSQTGQARKDTD